jgi:hypothetical protein
LALPHPLFLFQKAGLKKILATKKSGVSFQKAGLKNPALRYDRALSFILTLSQKNTETRTNIKTFIFFHLSGVPAQKNPA